MVEFLVGAFVLWLVVAWFLDRIDKGRRERGLPAKYFPSRPDPGFHYFFGDEQVEPIRIREGDWIWGVGDYSHFALELTRVTFGAVEVHAYGKMYTDYQRVDFDEDSPTGVPYVIRVRRGEAWVSGSTWDGEKFDKEADYPIGVWPIDPNRTYRVTRLIPGAPILWPPEWDGADWVRIR